MKKFIFSVAVMLLAFCVYGETIYTVTIRGLKKAPEEKVRSAMESKKGAQFSPEMARRDIKAIFALGYFLDVNVLRNDRAEGPELIVVVVERPVIRNIKYNGAEEISTYDLETDNEWKAGMPFELFKLKKVVDKMIEMYKEKGYSKPEITYDVAEFPADNSVDLTLNVKKGKKYTVGSVTVKGSKAFSVDAIRGKMETTTPGFLIPGTYKEEVLAKDIEKITEYYKSEGFTDIKCESQTSIDEAALKAAVTVNITEGPQYKQGDIRIKVETPAVFSADEVAEVFQVSKEVVKEEKDRLDEKHYYACTLKAAGDKVYNEKAVKMDIQRASQLYASKGYIAVKIQQEPTIDNEKKTVSLFISINEGKVFFVDKVLIDGNYKTHDNVIEREIRVKAGEPFDGDKLRLSLEKIYNLGFFEEVNYNLVPNAVDPNKQTLEIKLKERPTGNMNVGASYSSVDGLAGQLAVTENNLLGTGQRLSASWEFGALVQNYEIDYLEPYFLNEPTSIGGSVYKRTNSTFVDYQDQRVGGNIRVGLPGGDFTRWWFTYQYEQINIFNVSATASSIIQNAQGVSATSSFSVNWIEDTRDSIFVNTRRGHRYSATFEYAGGLLLGDNNYTKYILDSSWFLRYYGDLVLALHVNGSYITGFGSTAGVPFFEKFFCGGTDTVRGYDERKLSPTDQGVSVGGNFMVYANLENRFPIAGQLYGTMFFDIGKAYDSPLAFQPSNLSAGVGVGIRFVISGAMMIRLDYGIGLDPAFATPGGKVHFNIGNIF